MPGGHDHASQRGREPRTDFSLHRLNRDPRHAGLRPLTSPHAQSSHPRPRPTAGTPGTPAHGPVRDQTPGTRPGPRGRHQVFFCGKPIAERKAPSAPEHRNWRGSSSDPRPRKQQLGRTTPATADLPLRPQPPTSPSIRTDLYHRPDPHPKPRAPVHLMETVPATKVNSSNGIGPGTASRLAGPQEHNT